LYNKVSYDEHEGQATKNYILKELKMNQLIVFEKSSMAQAIISSLNKNKKLYNSYFSKYDSIEFVVTQSFGLYHFSYPKGKKYKEYPLVSPLETKFNFAYFKEEEISLRYNIDKYKEIKFNAENILSYEVKESYVDEEVFKPKYFDDLMICVDKDHSGVFSAINLLSNLYGKDRESFFQTKYFYQKQKRKPRPSGLGNSLIYYNGSRRR
jgi:hypothetical protein